MWSLVARAAGGVPRCSCLAPPRRPVVLTQAPLLQPPPRMSPSSFACTAELMARNMRWVRQRHESGYALRGRGAQVGSGRGGGRGEGGTRGGGGGGQEVRLGDEGEYPSTSVPNCPSPAPPPPPKSAGMNLLRWPPFPPPHQVTARIESAGMHLRRSLILRLDTHMVITNRTGYNLQLTQLLKGGGAPEQQQQQKGGLRSGCLPLQAGALGVPLHWPQRASQVGPPGTPKPPR